MFCPKCRSKNVHRSLRRGVYQGLFQRLVFRAAYRCQDCGRRFAAFSFGHRTDGRKHRTFAGWLGFRGTAKMRFVRKVTVGTIALILVVVAVYVALYLSEPSTRVQPTP